MARVEQTKLQVLRGAVQDNFDILHGIKTRPTTETPRPLRHWLWGLLLIAGMAYLGTPASVVPIGKASAPSAPAPAPVVASFRPAGEPDVMVSRPQPLNREIFPLSLKRIVIDPGHGGDDNGDDDRSGSNSGRG